MAYDGMHAGRVEFDKPAPEYDLSKFQAVECTAGTLVLLQGENVHYSAENTSKISRHSFSMHVVEGTEGINWPANNWAIRHKGSPAGPWLPLYELIP